MTVDDINFDDLRGLTIGTVEFVSPIEIKVLLELNAPQNTALNTGSVTLFPKINGYVLIPNEAGALVGIISWIGIEHAAFPKRKGFKDFDLVDLPFPLRKMSVSPLGIIRKDEDGYCLDRGVYGYPSIGDAVVIPTSEQLKAIVENKSPNALVKIGNSPYAANASVYIDPDRLFGRHVAVLGNTGSGKSCSVAGLVRWCFETAKKNLPEGSETLNARFIILDPNGEYSNVFDDIAGVRKFKVSPSDDETDFQKLKVPAWMWNSYEWSSIAMASGRTQRPLLRRALRDLRGGGEIEDSNISIRTYYSSCLVEIRNDLKRGATAFKGKPGKNEFGKKIQSISNDAKNDSDQQEDDDLAAKLNALSTDLGNIASGKYQTFTDNGRIVEYYNDFEKADVESAARLLDSFLSEIGGTVTYEGPDEDSPAPFNCDDLPGYLERLSQEQGVQQFTDFLIMRIRTMLSDTRMSSIIGSDDQLSLVNWLENYVGKTDAENGEIAIIDLSLVPSDIIFIVVAVIARIIFEALQRCRRKCDQLLPTVIVMEEAHNFISRYKKDDEEISSARLCSQTFEKIAKEGRKFGLGLMLSSQRPSELSQTVLSQCNTFLLHRLVNDRDQELVKKLVPDNLGSILNELPVLPSKKAILLGWAAPVPVLVDMNELHEDHRPNAADPEYWDIWTRKKKCSINWQEIVAEWRGSDGDDKEEGQEEPDIEDGISF